MDIYKSKISKMDLSTLENELLRLNEEHKVTPHENEALLTEITMKIGFDFLNSLYSGSTRISYGLRNRGNGVSFYLFVIFDLTFTYFKQFLCAYLFQNLNQK